ncbi:MAG: glycosyltransferase family 2 protein [Thermoproteota archaeon]
MPPIVSLCVPTHDRASIIGYTIESILHQDFYDFELLVFDDASKDNTKLIIDRYPDPRLQYIRTEKNLGQVGVQNRLIEMAAGKYIIFTHDDNVLSESMIRKCVDVLEANPDVMFVAPLSRLIDSEGNVVHEPKKLGDKEVYVISGEEMIFQFLPDFTINTKAFNAKKVETSFPSAMFRREKLIEAGKFDNDVLVACDLLLQSKLCLMGKVALINEVLFDYRLHDNWGSKLSKEGSYSHEFDLLVSRLLEFARKKSDASFSLPDFEKEVKLRMGKYLFSFSGGIPRIAAKYRGSYAQRAKAIMDTAHVAQKYNPSIRYNPKSWIILILSFLVPQAITRRLEGIYLQMTLKS